MKHSSSCRRLYFDSIGFDKLKCRLSLWSTDCAKRECCPLLVHEYTCKFIPIYGLIKLHSVWWTLKNVLKWTIHIYSSKMQLLTIQWCRFILLNIDYNTHNKHTQQLYWNINNSFISMSYCLLPTFNSYLDENVSGTWMSVMVLIKLFYVRFAFKIKEICKNTMQTINMHKQCKVLMLQKTQFKAK